MYVIMHIKKIVQVIGIEQINCFEIDCSYTLIKIIYILNSHYIVVDIVNNENN